MKLQLWFIIGCSMMFHDVPSPPLSSVLFVQAILEVFPRLINQMIVEMMRPDASKSAAIATFEALCNFWRTFRWLVDTRPKLRGRVGTRLSNFVKDESFRR
jgi:hypothetical protein